MLGEIRGTKFDDYDEDGVWDAVEPGIPDWHIFLDTNFDGNFTPGEQDAWTDPSGNYTIRVNPGTYTVAEEQQPGWVQTYPGSPEAGEESHVVTVGVRETIEDVDFGSAYDIELIDVALVPVLSPSLPTLPALPDPIDTVSVGGTYYVEVWVQDIGTPSLGVTAGSVDLHYTTASADATALFVDFPFLPSGRIDDANGLVDDLGGMSIADPVGVAPEWSRLGYVELVCTAEGEVTFDLSAGGSFNFSQPPVTVVSWGLVDLSDTATVNQSAVRSEPAPAAATKSWADRAAVLGALPAVAGEDWYSFDLEAGQSASLVLAGLSGGQVTLELFDDAARLLAIGSSAENAQQVINNFAAPIAGGTYYARVSGADVLPGEGDYSLVVTRNAAFDTEPNDEVAPLAQDITLSGTVLGSLRGGAPLIDTETEPNDDGIPGGSLGDLPLANDWSGSFTSIGGDDYQAVLTGNISAGNDADWDFFKILASPGDSLAIALNGVSLGDPYLWLFDNTGTQIASNDDYNGLDSYLEYSTFSYEGDYYVVADSFGGGTGTYQLTGTLTTDQPVGVANDDFYAVEAAFGDTLEIATRTPAGGAGEFVNDFDPAVELLDPRGVAVAFDDNGAGDGRNAMLAYRARSTGTYSVRVLSENDTFGEYVLEVTGHTGAMPPLEVTGTSPFDGEHLGASPAEITVDFNDTLLVTSLDAADLTVDGVPATAVSIVENDRAVFDLPLGLAEGPHTVQIQGIEDIQGTLLSPYTTLFFVDYTAPRVIFSSMQQGDEIPVGALIYTVGFDEPLEEANLDPTDVQLTGLLTGTYSPDEFSYLSSTSTLTIRYENLPEDAYTLTLVSGDGALEDTVGHDLDGEPLSFPIPPNRSGNGVPGGDFVVNFTTDSVTLEYPVPMQRI